MDTCSACGEKLPAGATKCPLCLVAVPQDEDDDPQDEPLDPQDEDEEPQDEAPDPQDEPPRPSESQPPPPPVSAPAHHRTTAALVSEEEEERWCGCGDGEAARRGPDSDCPWSRAAFRSRSHSSRSGSAWMPLVATAARTSRPGTYTCSRRYAASAATPAGLTRRPAEAPQAAEA